MHSAQLCGPAGPRGVRLPSHHIYASGAEVIVLASALSQMHSCGGKNFLGRALLNFQSRLCVTSDGQQTPPGRQTKHPESRNVTC